MPKTNFEQNSEVHSCLPTNFEENLEFQPCLKTNFEQNFEVQHCMPTGFEQRFHVQPSLNFFAWLYFATASYTVDTGHPKNLIISVAERQVTVCDIGSSVIFHTCFQHHDKFGIMNVQYMHKAISTPIAIWKNEPRGGKFKFLFFS